MQNSTRNTIISIAAVIILIAGGWYIVSRTHNAPSPAAAGASDAVAMVNGKSISRADLTATEAQINSQNGATATSTDAQAQVQSQALDSLIAQKLLSQAAKAAGITASSTEVDAQIASTKAQFATDDAYQQALTAQGLTEDTLRAQIAESLAINDYLNQTLDLSSVTATDAEIQAAYDQVAAQQAGVPALADVRDQVEQAVIQQKQQQIINTEVAKLRSAGNVQILI